MTTVIKEPNLGLILQCSIFSDVSIGKNLSECIIDSSDLFGSHGSTVGLGEV